MKKNHSLKSGKSEKYKVRIEFKKDITATQLPGAEKSFTFNFQVDFVQADDNAVDVEHAMYVYTTNTDEDVSLNQLFPSTINKFNSGSETGKSIYLKHKLRENDLVEESYVEFVIDAAFKTALKTNNCNGDSTCEAKVDALVNDTYIIKAINYEDLVDPETGDCKAEYTDGEENCEISYYASNVETMRRAFGTLADDENVCFYGSSYSYCNAARFYVSIESFDDISVQDGGWICNFEQGDSNCHEY